MSAGRRLRDAVPECQLPPDFDQHVYSAQLIAAIIAELGRQQVRSSVALAGTGFKPFKLEELQAFLKDKLGKHEMVQALEIRAELPKTAVGKLSKKELYDEEERAARAQA
ncbi:hypothetical protein HU230_0035350 [Bradyrhizobium quebecense]|uniref:AMP-binding enzyme C-terminal domain-containing protein n=1 Tax=Bradyrhizobium quebecense TaxID=2748629 RepID=A0A974AHZ7_9BRAD|nr:hypothetical protein [Bradyrhizobium quebecense]UGA43483.1 hypothetical protein HU230_0035350 [Bradyrhizobium quebecense]